MKDNKKRILVLDGGNQNTLAIVRHLGLLDLCVDVVSYNHFSPSSFSKYVSEKYIISSPQKNTEKFYSDLLSILNSCNYFLLMPVGYSSFEICMKHNDEIKKLTRIILTNDNAFEIASNKKKTYAFAESNGIPCPKTWNISSEEELEKAELFFPVVIKAPLEMGKNVVEYAHNKTEAIEKFKNMCDTYKFSFPNIPIVQEFIKGDGYGFFAYYENGTCKRIFMHKRIRENPPSGGVSTCAESFFDDVLLSYGKKMLDLLKWNGVAMVEFKKDEKDGIYKLMEVNPKFWGSLELAIASGVNFPYFLVMNTEGKNVEYSDKFKNIRFQWLLNGELFHFFSKPSSVFSILKDLFHSKKDFWWKDVLPNLVQVVLIFSHYFKKLTGK